MAIHVKWPEARLVGPSVSKEHALEFILKTDPFLVGKGFTNNREFEAQFRKVMQLGENPYISAPRKPLGQIVGEQERLEVALGHIHLRHLASHWVATCYIGGPYGPVSPDGTIHISTPFGKWPDEEEIEDDLTKLAENFPWLTFDLSIWGETEEGTDGPPSDSWHLENGAWTKIDPKPIVVDASDPILYYTKRWRSLSREITWTVKELDEMWGDKIRSARAVALSPT